MAELNDLFEVMYTNRAHREFKLDVVPDELIEKVLDAAVHAPSGSNSQKWRFVVITDPEMRAKIGAEYKESFYNRPIPGRPSGPSRGPSHLPDTIGTEPPVLILVCMENEPGAEPAKRTTGASIYPAVQNLMLAARAFGLGTVLTTIHQHRESQIKEILGIPAHVDTYALIPMGFPVKGFGPLTRKAPSEVSFRDRWGQAL
ncbi:MAG: nitroreductase family protein [Chloroflexota bacterium]